MKSCAENVRAELAELADALDSGSSAARLPGSSPGFRILFCINNYSALISSVMLLGEMLLKKLAS